MRRTCAGYSQTSISFRLACFICKFRLMQFFCQPITCRLQCVFFSHFANASIKRIIKKINIFSKYMNADFSEQNIKKLSIWGLFLNPAFIKMFFFFNFVIARENSVIINFLIFIFKHILIMQYFHQYLTCTQFYNGYIRYNQIWNWLIFLLLIFLNI